VLTLHGVQPRALLLAHQVYLSNIALADQLDLVEATGPDFDIAYLDAVAAVSPTEGGRTSDLARARNARHGEQIGGAAHGDCLDH
jgi:hypothetical protein